VNYGRASGVGGAGDHSGWALFVAQGFGVGRLPVAPGTFGSLVGLGWTVLLLQSRSAWLILAGLLAGIVLSVWLTGQAERMLGQRDPGSVVLDEIVAMPVCFAAWIGLEWLRLGRRPELGHLLTGSGWLWPVGIFLAFRFFDVVKPWPVRQSQRLSGGWGVTVDDLLAALYVNVVTLGLGLARAPLS
jgi:phosphatidylglycerophosphatase A